MKRRIILGGIASSAVFARGLVETTPTGASRRPRPAGDQAATRLARAREFAHGLDRHIAGNVADFLYQAGIVTQLALTAYLFDKGLDDAWCRDRIGLDVAKALAFANDLGLGCDCDRTAELARLLSPYGQWRLSMALILPAASLVRPRAAAIDVARLLERVEMRLAEGRPR